MGVLGLSSLIYTNNNIFEKIRLHDTRLIIDGSNLYHILYNNHVPNEYGGNYDTYANTCKTFFRTLTKCKVDAYVVMDGGYDPDDRKWKTVLKRKASRIKSVGTICGRSPKETTDHVLPILCEETFYHVLRELQIPHVACPYEANREISVLANKWDCPVLSDDSDFFIFKLENGVIPIKGIDLTLRPLKTQTEQSALQESETSPTDQEDIYISVKCYRYSTLIKTINVPWKFLPILATFSGNDYVDPRNLEGFHEAIRWKHRNKELNLRAASPKLMSVVHWAMGIQSEEYAINYVLNHVENLAPVGKSKLRDALRNSIDSYTDIRNFATIDLVKFFDANTDDESRPDRGTLIDYVTKHPLPAWFSEMLRTCEMATFLQNVAVNHRVIFNCQIEHLANPSTYECSQHIRSVLYGLITQFKRPKYTRYERKTFLTNDIRKFCIEENDRLENEMMKVRIRPTFRNVPGITGEENQKFIFGTLGLNSELVDSLTADPCTKFLIGVLRFWWTHADPKITENYLSSAVIGFISLHSHFFQDMKCSPDVGKTVKLPCLVPSIVKAIEGQGKTRMNQFASEIKKHKDKSTDQASRDNEEITIIHGFSQLQTCYLSALYLNQALMSPVDLPSPGVLFNFTFMFNVCKSLETLQNNDFSDMFPLESPLHDLFKSWKTAVTELEDRPAVDEKVIYQRENMEILRC
ncbi:protein asteroid homolog 1-like [Mya arenaria]|uniref:protein asteroid homolog 1-like n=1 Tax=Mya arenaria TaxID=6604 RepID=UPI0022E797D0|nr:protein asteroid homolog 1-like [Mya arenaria]